MVDLREHQVAAIAAVKKAAAGGRMRNVVVLPTGTGKTITGEAYADGFARTLWLAHRDELIEQPIATLERYWPGRRYGVVKAERDERLAPIVFGSIASVAQARRLESDWGEPFGLVVVDEAHHASSASYVRALERFAPRGGPTQVLGLTATPGRADGKGLDEVFDAIAYQLEYARAVELGLLVGATADRVVLDVDMEKFAPSDGGDFDSEALGQELVRAGAADAVARVVAGKASDRKTVIFTCSVDQAVRTAEALNAHGVPADWVSGERKLSERRAVLARHRAGEILAVTNCAVLTEGYDDPSIECVVIARPTRSSGMYIQMAGRGLRPSPGKADCLIIDLVGAHEIHGLATIATLAGVGATGGLTVDERECTEEQKNAAAAGIGADALLRSFLALATNQAASASIGDSRLAWVSVRADLWALDLGREFGTACLRELAPGEWTAEVVLSGRGAEPASLEGSVFSDADDTGERSIAAMRHRVEAYALSIGARPWRRNATWRRAPAGEKILGALEKWRRKPKEAITAGEASDILVRAAMTAAYRNISVDRNAAARAVLTEVASHGCSLRPGAEGKLWCHGGAKLPKDLQRRIATYKPELLLLVEPMEVRIVG